MTKCRDDGILKTPSSRGSSGALYHQSAIVGVISCRGLPIAELPSVSGVDSRVSRDGNP